MTDTADVLAELRELVIRSRLPLTFNATDAAAYIGVGRTRFYQLESLGRFRAVDMGRAKVYRRADLDRYVDSLKPAR